MIRIRQRGVTGQSLAWQRTEVDVPRLGTVGHSVLLVWALAVVMIVPARSVVWAGAFCLAVGAILYPGSLRRLLKVRWLVMAALLALPPMFLLGESDRVLWGISLSSTGLEMATQIVVRLAVVVVAVGGFTAAVDIGSLAGLLERLGMQGLGFSLGVALNFLPALQNSAMNAWHSLWMRGGLRKQKWRGLQLLVVTVMANALRRAEDIALAAEARAFSPENARPLPVCVGCLDRWAAIPAVASLVLFWLVGAG